jgi:hypothetical protein
MNHVLLGTRNLQMETVKVGCYYVCLFLMPLSILFQLYRGGQFYWWKKPSSTNNADLHIKLFKVALSTHKGCCGRDRMVVGFTTTYATSVYHHLWVRIPLRPGVLDTTVCDKVCQVVHFLQVSSTNKPHNPNLRHPVSLILIQT